MLTLLASWIACGGDSPDSPTPTPAPTRDGSASPSPSAAGETGPPPEGQGELELGQHIALSGADALAYRSLIPAYRAFFTYINEEHGGVCGRPISLIVEDDQGSPLVAREKAQRLAEEHEVATFVGNLGTPPNLGSAEYINEHEIPNLFIGSGSPALGDPETFPWTILFNPDFASEGTVLARYFNEDELGGSVGILYQDDDFGQSGRQAFLDQFDGDVVADETIPPDATDIESQMATLHAANPSIVYIRTTTPYVAQALAYMANQGWAPRVAISYVNSVSALATLLGGEAGPAEGFTRIEGLVTTNYILDPVIDAENPDMQEHARIMSEFGGPPVDPLTIYAQAVAESVVHTLEIACENGDMTRAGIMEAAESIEGFHPSVLLEGIDISLSDEDHSAIQSLVPVEIQADGTLMPLVDEPIEADAEGEEGEEEEPSPTQ